MKTVITLQLTIVLLLSTTYVVNAYKLMQCDFESPYKEEIIYGIGAVTPFSIVTVWYNKED